MEEIFLHRGIQRKRFSSIVGYNGVGFPPLWDAVKEVSSIVGYNGEKRYNRIIFLNFECLSLPLNKIYAKSRI
jgi:hypothetical protein